MLRTPLNPEVIIGNNRGNSESFSNFLTGSSKGPATSDVASASNNIVGFSGSNVSNKTSDLTQLISSITTNVTNNINNSINVTNQGFQKQIDSLTNSIQKSTKDSSKNSKQTDNFSSKGILEKFLKVYNNAIGFITTFADTKYIKRISSNLKALRNLFTESFNIAKILRQVIIKIVKQLSNLPTASPTAGGLNLDVNVPAGKLRQAGGPKIRNIGKALAIGGGVVAAGAAAIGMQNAQKFQQEKFASTTTETKGGSTLQEDFASKLGSIVDGFSKSVENLLKGNKKSPDISSTGGGLRRSEGPPKGPPGSVDSNINPADIKADTPEAKAAIATIRQVEGTAGKEGYSKFFGGSTYGGDLTKKTVSEVVSLQHKFRAAGGLGRRSAAVGAGQFMTPEVYTRKMGLDPSKQLFDEEFQNRLIVFFAAEKRGIDLNKPLSKKDFDILQLEWAGLGPHYGQTGRTTSQSFDMYLKNLQKVKSSTITPAQKPPSKVNVKPPNKPQNLSSAVPTLNTNQSPTVASISLPPEVYNTSNDSDNKSNPITPPMADGPTVAILPAGNGQNWWSLYSKMVYNIVDC